MSGIHRVPGKRVQNTLGRLNDRLSAKFQRELFTNYLSRITKRVRPRYGIRKLRARTIISRRVPAQTTSHNLTRTF